jgi:GntR family transcriptional regulator/MocR family aminotransferase
LRLAYAVIPDSLLDRFVAAKSIVDRFTPPLLQAVLADFIEGGHFGRHLRQMREVYAERRAALLTALEVETGDMLEVTGASAGLSLTVRRARGFDDVAACKALEASGLEALPLSLQSRVPRSATPGLILGFAPFSPARLRKRVISMREVLGRLP